MSPNLEMNSQSKSPTMLETARVKFDVSCEDTEMGELLRIVGSDASLGSWDPSRGLLLTTGPEFFPQWSATAALSLNEGSLDVEYKYVRDRRALGEGFLWEPTPNRKLVIAIASFTGESANWYVSDKNYGCDVASVIQPFETIVSDTDLQQDASFESQFQLVGDAPLEFGTFGSIWLCKSHVAGGEDLAVKRIDKTRLKERDIVNLFGRNERDGEIRLHSNLEKHPNIVKLLKVIDGPTIASLVLELCHGGDLFNRLNEQKQRTGRGLLEPDAVVVLRQVSEALAFLHSKRIAHRDIKCENVLLTYPGKDIQSNVLKICDFGFAAKVPEHGHLRTCLGSLVTVAPEVARQLPYSLPVDCWAVGVMLYIVLSTKFPFEADSPSRSLAKVIHCEFDLKSPFWDTISTEAKQVIRDLLVVDPHSRITAWTVLQRPLIQGDVHQREFSCKREELAKFPLQEDSREALGDAICETPCASRDESGRVVDASAESCTEMESDSTPHSFPRSSSLASSDLSSKDASQVPTLETERCTPTKAVTLESQAVSKSHSGLSEATRQAAARPALYSDVSVASISTTDSLSSSVTAESGVDAEACQGSRPGKSRKPVKDKDLHKLLQRLESTAPPQPSSLPEENLGPRVGLHGQESSTENRFAWPVDSMCACWTREG